VDARESLASSAAGGADRQHSRGGRQASDIRQLGVGPSYAPEESRSADMLVLIRWQGRKLPVPLSQLAAIDVDESTADAITIGIIG
jgi:hypothetical protein